LTKKKKNSNVTFAGDFGVTKMRHKPMIKQANGDVELEKLTVLVPPDVAALLRNEAARRYRAIGARWPLGTIIGELVRKEYDGSATHEMPKISS